MYWTNNKTYLYLVIVVKPLKNTDWNHSFKPATANLGSLGPKEKFWVKAESKAFSMCWKDTSMALIQQKGKGKNTTLSLRS